MRCVVVNFFISLVALLKGVNGHYFSFSSPENMEKVWGVLQRKTGLNPQCFLLTVPRRTFIDFWRSPLSNWKLKIKKIKIRKTQKIVISLCMLRLCILRVCDVLCVFVRAILSWCPLTWLVHIVYNMFSLNISSIYINLLK